MRTRIIVDNSQRLCKAGLYNPLSRFNRTTKFEPIIYLRALIGGVMFVHKIISGIYDLLQSIRVIEEYVQLIDHFVWAGKYTI